MLFKRRIKAANAPPSVEPGSVVYAIGDVHGRADLLARLLEQISDDAEKSAADRKLLVFLGDYVDRGPDSRAVVDLVISALRDPLWQAHALKGNHELALLSFMADATLGPTWATYGGLATLQSYTGRAPNPVADAEAWEAAREALVEAMPQAHTAFYEGLELYFVCGDYCFVHAGLRPGVPLEAQDPMDLMMIRRDFLSHKRAWEKVVVYGHTPNIEPVVEEHRIGIDTGAFATGVLTCLKLDGPERTFIQVRP